MSAITVTLEKHEVETVITSLETNAIKRTADPNTVAAFVGRTELLRIAAKFRNAMEPVT